VACNDRLIRRWHLTAKRAGSRGASLAESADAAPSEHECRGRTMGRDPEALEVCFPLCGERFAEVFQAPAFELSRPAWISPMSGCDLMQPLAGIHAKNCWKWI
jgi:hypothetical protein